jgi:hypothetical protein
LEFPGKLKLSTITNPGKVISGGDIISFRNFVQFTFWPLVARLFPCGISRASLEKNKNGNPPLVNSWVKTAMQPSYFPILKSGTFGQGIVSTSPKSMSSSAKAWLKNESMFSILKEWITSITPPPAYRRPPAASENFLKDLIKAGTSDVLDQSNVPLGKLALKQEAAGKIRVFAIVDNWTQWILHPLHSSLFTLLRLIPTDGTFDQLAPVKRLRLTRKTTVFSFDLSAATDRLPLQFQKMILGPVLGIHLAEI